MKTVFFIILSLISCVTLAQKIDLMQAPTSSEEIALYEKYVLDNAPSEDAFIAVQRLAERYIRKELWTESISVYSKYRPLFISMIKRFDKIIDMLAFPNEGLSMINLGSGINTDSNEYLPKITIDGKKIYFCSDNRDGCNGSEKIFYSDFLYGNWNTTRIMDKFIKTDNNEALLAISPDGNKVILFSDYGNDFGDLYESERTKSGWSKVKHFSKPLNSPHFEADAFITSDGKHMLFVSDRPNGTGEFNEKGAYFHGANSGNTDIYICEFIGDSIGKITNLGLMINTSYCERTPFLHPDGKTLFFSSDGHYGIGRLDVFVTTRLNDSSWTEWTEPINLGKEINSAGNDWGYQIATDGKSAYFSSRNRREGFGEEDIFSVTLPKKLRPEPVATVHGKIMDSKGNPVEAKIKWEDLFKNLNIGDLKSNPKDGGYFITLPLGKSYGYYAEKQGYYPVSKNIDLRNDSISKDITEDIVLYSIDDLISKENFVKINNIFFELGKTDFNEESLSELNRLASFLIKYPQMKIEIAGHTDNTGTAEYNLVLSRTRAQSIVHYLISKGCRKENLIAVGYGAGKPIVPNTTNENKTINRRVEFRLLK